MTKILSATAALLMTATIASAEDFAIAGQTVSVGGEFDMNYTTGTEVWALEFEPTAGFAAYGADFEVSTTIDLLGLNDASADTFQGLEFEAGYTLGNGLRAYGEVATDKDLEFGDLTAGMTFAF